MIYDLCCSKKHLRQRTSNCQAHRFAHGQLALKQDKILANTN